jgi:hypothetical protein
MIPKEIMETLAIIGVKMRADCIRYYDSWYCTTPLQFFETSGQSFSEGEAIVVAQVHSEPGMP